jgi:hypothetical protein
VVASPRSNIGFQPAQTGVRIIGYLELIIGLRGFIQVGKSDIKHFFTILLFRQR